MEEGRCRDIGLFRYSLVRPMAEPGLACAERGALARELAGVDHIGPDGEAVRVGRSTLDRWARAYRSGASTRWSLPRARARRARRQRRWNWRWR